MNKKLAICILTVLVVASWGMSPQAAEIVIKYADTVAPDHPNNLAALEFKKMVEKETNGRVRVDVFPAAQLGNEKELVEACMLGAIDMFQCSSGALSLFQPEFGALASPYIFRDLDHMLKVAAGPIGQELGDKLQKSRGIKLLANNWYYGSRHLTTKSKPIYKPADLKGMLIRSVEQPIFLETVRALGGTPTPVDFSDLYMALKQGAVEGQENPIPTIYTYKYYEAQKYIMLTGHIILTIYNGANAEWYNALPDDVKAVIEKAMAQATTFNNDLVVKQEIELIEKLKDQGMTVVEPDVAAFREACKDVHLKFEKEWGKGLYEEIIAVQ